MATRYGGVRRGDSFYKPNDTKTYWRLDESGLAGDGHWPYGNGVVVYCDVATGVLQVMGEDGTAVDPHFPITPKPA